jgi:hypothetical protein
MDFLWLLAGSYQDDIHKLHLVEYDVLERTLRLSDYYIFTKKEYNQELDEITQELDDFARKEIHKLADKGICFLAKEVIHVNGNKLFNFGYYTKTDEEHYTFVSLDKHSHKTIFRQLIQQFFIDKLV